MELIAVALRGLQINEFRIRKFCTSLEYDVYKSTAGNDELQIRKYKLLLFCMTKSNETIKAPNNKTIHCLYQAITLAPLFLKPVRIKVRYFFLLPLHCSSIKLLCSLPTMSTSESIQSTHRIHRSVVWTLDIDPIINPPGYNPENLTKNMVRRSVRPLLHLH